jgi:hypothetical protein
MTPAAVLTHADNQAGLVSAFLPLGKGVFI